MKNKDLLTHITDPKVIHEAAMKANEEQRKMMDNAFEQVMEDQKGWEARYKKKFGLCDENGKCDCQAEIKFIRQVEREAYARGYKIGFVDGGEDK